MKEPSIVNRDENKYNGLMIAGKNAEHCLVCGSKLDYLRQSAPLGCMYCGTQEHGHIKCPNGHFVCDACHGKSAIQMIEDIAFTTQSKDPVEIAELMMGHPNLPMLGCEHAYVAAGSLLAALKNSPYGKGANDDIREAFLRTSRQAIGGYCGLTGVCGIVPAVGACFSIFLGAHCGTDREQRTTMEAATEVSRAIAGLTGPSCCKAYVRAALSVAVALFSERFGIALPVKQASPVCKHSAKHPHGCREEKCPYYKREASRDIFADSIHMPVSYCGPT
jgi:hypothetical protein